MSVWLFGAFLALMSVEGLGTAAFLAIYLRGDWRSTSVGRHLAYYAIALLGLYVSTLASFFVHSSWLVLVILVLHAVWAGVIWQRVWLVWRAHRQR